MRWIRLGIRELARNRGFAFFFVVNLAVGLCGFIAVRSFSHSLNRHLSDNLREILTADLVIVSRTPLTPGEDALASRLAGPDAQKARLVMFYTMVRSGPKSRLMRVMAMDAAYPLYGGFSLEHETDPGRIQDEPGVLMTRDAAFALGVDAPSDGHPVLGLGQKRFYVADFIRDDPDKALTGLDLAPKVYMGISHLAETGLIRFGSRIRYFSYFRLTPGTDVPGLVTELKQGFAGLSPGHQRANIYDSRDVSRSLARITGHFTGYMALVSLVALFMAGIAAAYLFRAFLGGKLSELAILMSLGARRRHLLLYLFAQLMLLGLAASALAIACAAGLLPSFPHLLQDLVPAGVRVDLDGRAVALAVATGTLGSLVFCLPVLIRIAGIKPKYLLRKTMPSVRPGPGLLMAGFAPGAAAFALGSVAVAGSVRNGLIFCGGFALVLVLLAAIGWLGFRVCRMLSRTRNLVRKMAFRNLYRNQWTSLACFVTIAMGVFLISLIPQVQKGLQTEIMRPRGLRIPVFFLVDIQDEQAPELRAFMSEQPGELANLSPMVRGRILRVNGQPFDAGKNGLSDRGRPRRLEYNFSYRKALDRSESIVRGDPLSPVPWSFESDQPFEISVAKSFAADHGLSIGDLMSFDVQGIPLEGRIINIRKVRWNSFQPNFFLLFQTGVLEAAPKTWLASVSGVPPGDRQSLKHRIVERFPNVSVIDVTAMMKTLTTITDRLSVSVRFMAWLAIAAGLVSIFSIARHQARQQARQVNLLKVLGAGFSDIRAITLVEFGSLGFSAGLTAVILSIGFSRAISWYLFDSLWQLDLVFLSAILILTTLICILTSLAASRKILKTKPVLLLKNGG